MPKAASNPAAEAVPKAASNPAAEAVPEIALKSAFKNQTMLKNWAVVITRPAHQAAAISAAVRALGGQLIAIPSIAILPLRNADYLDQCLQRQAVYDLSIFVSQNAVRAVFSRLEQLNLQWHGEVAAVGAASAAALAARLANVTAPDVAADYRSEGLLKTLAKRDLKGLKIAIYRAQSGRDWLQQQLEKRGAQVDFIAAYHRQPISARVTRQTLEQHGKAARLICLCNSLESVNFFIARLDAPAQELLAQAPMVVPSERVARQARRHVDNVIVAKSALDADMLAAIPARLAIRQG